MEDTAQYRVKDTRPWRIQLNIRGKRSLEEQKSIKVKKSMPWRIQIYLCKVKYTVLFKVKDTRSWMIHL